jgi:hypothetical protein
MLCDNCLPQSLTGSGNLVLQDTVERLFAQNLYADVDRGLFLVRGENVLLLGEIVRCQIQPRPAPNHLLTTLNRIWTETIMFLLLSNKHPSTRFLNYTSKSRHKRRSRRRSGTRSWPHTVSRASTLERLFCDGLSNTPSTLHVPSAVADHQLTRQPSSRLQSYLTRSLHMLRRYAYHGFMIVTRLKQSGGLVFEDRLSRAQAYLLFEKHASKRTGLIFLSFL